MKIRRAGDRTTNDKGPVLVRRGLLVTVAVMMAATLTPARAAAAVLAYGGGDDVIHQYQGPPGPLPPSGNVESFNILEFPLTVEGAIGGNALDAVYDCFGIGAGDGYWATDQAVPTLASLVLYAEVVCSKASGTGLSELWLTDGEGYKWENFLAFEWHIGEPGEYGDATLPIRCGGYLDSPYTAFSGLTFACAGADPFAEPFPPPLPTLTPFPTPTPLPTPSPLPTPNPGPPTVTRCNDDPPPGDVWIDLQVSGTRYAFFGADPDLTGSGAYVCAFDASLGIVPEDPNPATTGMAVRIASCPAEATETCTTVVARTGAEAGIVNPSTDLPGGGTAGAGASSGGTCIWVNGQAVIPCGSVTVTGVTVAEGDAPEVTPAGFGARVEVGQDTTRNTVEADTPLADQDRDVPYACFSVNANC